MSRIPLPSSLPYNSTPTSRPESPMSYPSPSPRPNPNSNGGAKRPESVYSVSNLSASAASTPLSESNLAETRKRQGRKDEAIRKKIESELSRKRPASKRTQQRPGGAGAPRPKQGTVSALRPLPALTVPHSISVADASQLCAAKRTDCVLVVDEDEHLCGIFTAKDLAFRVVGDGLDPRTTLVSAIMTPNPMVTRDSTSATEALQTMVTRGFRHLPVCNEDGDVVGLLDITKVFHESLEKLEKAYGSSQKLYSALEGAQEQFGGVEGAANPLMAYVQALRDKMSFPDLGSILDARTAPATVTVKTTVRDAAKLMRERRTTAVCVMENDGKKIAGIFTSKDVVLRVIAAGLDSKTCSVVRVMTPHPDVGLPSLSIQDALRKMHDGHYLNLPVVDEAGSLVGIVDVLKLTYATLEQVNSIGADGGAADAAGGPLWGRFFNAVGGDDADTESVVSGQDQSEMRPPQTPVSRRQLVDTNFDTPGSEVFPNDSASAIYEDERLSASEVGARRTGMAPASSIGTGAPLPPVDDGTYLFKFVAPSGTTHRFQARYDSYEFITEIVSGKLASDPFFLQQGNSAPPSPADPDQPPPPITITPVHSDFQLLYLDDDGDLVLMTADRDVTDAVSVAKKQGKDRVVVHLRGGKGWDEAVERQSTSKKSKTVTIVEEKNEATPDRKTPNANGSGEELVLGFLTKEQLLPASVALLAAVIVGVFAATRVAQK